MDARTLIERLHGDGVSLSIDRDRLRFASRVDPNEMEILSELKRQKSSVMALLRSCPAYSEGEVQTLSDWYAAQDENTRVRITRRTDALRSEDGVPSHIALCLAIESERDDFNPRKKLRVPA